MMQMRNRFGEIGSGIMRLPRSAVETPCSGLPPAGAAVSGAQASAGEAMREQAMRGSDQVRMLSL
jgi:hypothetical protein